MELTTIQNIVLICGSVFGQIAHIVKKKAEGGSEMKAFKEWVWNRPANTAIAAVAGVMAAYALTVDGMTLVQVFFTAATAGVTANTAINRAGK